MMGQHAFDGFTKHDQMWSNHNLKKKNSSAVVEVLALEIFY